MSRVLSQSTVAEVQVESSQLNPTLPKPTDSISEVLLLLFFGLSVMGAIATFLMKELNYKRDVKDLKGQLSKIPCPNCQYFSKSSYLRCAVQPTRTMTTEALECPDFCSSAKN